eukprot:3431167-Lingulodinium_polyedra.AAC.1
MVGWDVSPQTGLEGPQMDSQHAPEQLDPVLDPAVRLVLAGGRADRGASLLKLGHHRLSEVQQGGLTVALDHEPPP